MIFSILNLENNIDQEIKKIRNKNVDLVYKSFNENENYDILFVYGGDGTYLNIIKKFINKKVLIVLIPKGKLSFLNSYFNYEKIDINKFDKLNFLNLEINNNDFNCLNEIQIESETLFNVEIKINNYLFRNILSSRIFCFSKLGSTGLARSRRYPIIFNRNNFIIDFLDEPKYNYYKSLDQPLLLTSKDYIELNFEKEIKLKLKLDNQIFDINSKNVNIKYKESECLIYNFNNSDILLDKIKELF